MARTAASRSRRAEDFGKKAPKTKPPSDSHSFSPLPDYLAPRLKLLFVGINPGLISAAAGHYYANPRNCFWRLLHEAELTLELLGPDEDCRMLEFGYGLTDIVKRPSRGAADLRAHEFAANRQRLLRLVRRLKPRAVCFNSKTAFEGAFGKRLFADSVAKRFALPIPRFSSCPQGAPPMRRFLSR